MPSRLLVFLLASLTCAASAAAQVTWRVSVDSSGAEGDDGSALGMGSASLSENGRMVVFESWAGNLVAGDTNGRSDIFVHDRVTGVTQRVSVASDGTQADKDSFNARISDDGRCIVFESLATTLVAGDTNGTWDVYLHDLTTGVTERVSLTSTGGEPDYTCRDAHVSADGSQVVFDSKASNLVPGDSNGDWDIFVRDRTLGTTTRVSVDSAGREAQGWSYRASVSGDGRWVCFSSSAANLVPGDTNGAFDVFLKDRQTGTTSRLSVDTNGTQGNDDSEMAFLASGGGAVVFESRATNLVANDTNGVVDYFVRDRINGTTTRVNVSSSGAQDNLGGPFFIWQPDISADGRYACFASGGNTLVPGDTNGKFDIFVHDREQGLTWRATVATDGTQANNDSLACAISDDGRVVAFDTAANNLVPGDSNGAWDVCVHGEQLHLDLDPPGVTAGDTLTVRCQEATPGTRALLFVDLVDAIPDYRWVTTGTFAADTRWVTAHPVPPGLAGNDFGFLVFTFGYQARPVMSNVAVLEVR